ncbi:MAG: hypothetical protein ACRD0J_17050, partial [Acidimicrobiales bacterium]
MAGDDRGDDREEEWADPPRGPAPAPRPDPAPAPSPGGPGRPPGHTAGGGAGVPAATEEAGVGAPAALAGERAGMLEGTDADARDHSSIESLEQGGLPVSARERLADMARSGSAWTSDLSVGELAAVRAAGFEPLGLVMGSSVYH